MKNKTEESRPQDLKFSQAELDRAFGKMSHADYLNSLRRNYGKKHETEEAE